MESTAGVAAGGRTGVTAIVTGLLFLGAIGAAPFVGIVPPAATAPALILVGSLMLATITEIRWHDPLVAVPAFLTLVLIPLHLLHRQRTGFGIISWAVLHLAHRQVPQPGLVLYLLAALFLARLHLPGRELGYVLAFQVAAARGTTMHWYYYCLTSLAGAFLSNTLPHLDQRSIRTAIPKSRSQSRRGRAVFLYSQCPVGLL